MIQYTAGNKISDIVGLQNALDAKTSGVSLGNIIFVSANAPLQNNAQSRAEALGRIDKPFQSLLSAWALALTGDIVFVLSNVTTSTILETKNVVLIIGANVKITSTSTNFCTSISAIGLGNSEILCNILTGAGGTFKNLIINCTNFDSNNGDYSYIIEDCSIYSTGEGIRPYNWGGYVYIKNSTISCNGVCVGNMSSLAYDAFLVYMIIENCKIINRSGGVAISMSTNAGYSFYKRYQFLNNFVKGTQSIGGWHPDSVAINHNVGIINLV